MAVSISLPLSIMADEAGSLPLTHIHFLFSLEFSAILCAEMAVCPNILNVSLSRKVNTDDAHAQVHRHLSNT